MASKVRVKLAKQAADPKSSLRLLVLQANMLDRLMDDITVNSKKSKPASKVTFSVPEKKREQQILLPLAGPNVTEYEVDSDSDSDSDDSDYISTGSDSDENVFDPEEDDYLSDSDDEEPVIMSATKHTPSKTLPVLESPSDRQLLIVLEEDEEEMPELTGLNSPSDSDSEDEISMPTYILSRTNSPYYPVGLSKADSTNVSVEDIDFKPQQESVAFSFNHVY